MNQIIFSVPQLKKLTCKESKSFAEDGPAK